MKTISTPEWSPELEGKIVPAIPVVAPQYVIIEFNRVWILLIFIVESEFLFIFLNFVISLLFFSVLYFSMRWGDPTNRMRIGWLVYGSGDGGDPLDYCGSNPGEGCVLTSFECVRCLMIIEGSMLWIDRNHFFYKWLVIFLLQNIMGEHSFKMFGGSKNVLMRSSDPRG